ncbi:hypothetical protein LINPERHAP2_LOCUS15469 [Linum perenne]
MWFFSGGFCFVLCPCCCPFSLVLGELYIGG